MQWTDAQQRTIDVRNKNILVSAAAGSGKTAVLIERIIQLVIKEGTSLDQFLITTFTDAAAAEMRERLEAAIMNELQKPDSDKVYLRKQLTLLPNANISTVHKFALEVIRSFFYLTDLQPGFQVSDEVQSSLMQKDAINELFERRFEEGSEEFLNFLRRRSSDRNDNRLKDLLIDSYKALRSIPHYMDWARKTTERLACDDPLDSLKLYSSMLKDMRDAVAKAARTHQITLRLTHPETMPNVHAMVSSECVMLDSALARLDEIVAGVSAGSMTEADAFHEASRQLGSVVFDTLRAKKDDKPAYDLIKDDIQKYRKKVRDGIRDIRSDFFAETMESMAEGIRATYEDTKYFVGLLEEFEEILKERKAVDNCIDFDDIMHYAIEILEDPKAAEEYKKKFEYIFVDEYQDSNQLQEDIVNNIARSNNVFMVGDVKQSIYKFRLAEPEIFMRKYEEYKSEKDENSIKIDLNSNFRSKKRVTDAVNRIFEKVMPGYDDDAKLHCSIEEEYPGEPMQMHIILKEGIDEEFLDSSDAESELLVQLIKETLGKEIYDSKNKVTRTVGYGDIAVLSRSAAVLADMERFLNNAGIPAYSQNSDGYYETVEVQVFVNILHIIDNMRQDVPLISAMRSVIFDFRMEELAKIRIHAREGSFYSAVKEYAASGPDEGIRNKIEAMFAHIQQWKEIQKTAPLDELLRMVMYDTGYFNYCSGLPAGKQRISNLRILLEKAAAYEEHHYDGLYGFLSYIEAMKESKNKVGEASLSGGRDDTVNLMTVHKSKGLEFPIVILVGTGRKITGGSARESILHKDFAIGLPQVNENTYTRKKTLLQKMIASTQSREGLDESVRILYVALTRAMDQLITIGTVDGLAKLEEGTGLGSYNEMMYETLGEMINEDPDSAQIIVHETLEAGQSEGAPADAGDAFSDADAAIPGDAGSEAIPGNAGSAADAETTADIDAFVNERLSYVYPYTPKEGIKPKYSVSELNKQATETIISISQLTSEEEEKAEQPLTAAQIGTAMHYVMERIDFAKAEAEGEDYIKAFAHGLLEKGLLSEEEHNAVRCDRIASFFEEEVGKRAAKAFAEGRLQRESEFILRKEIEGEKAIVQGVIDCFFEEEDGLVLIDYKNSWIGNRNVDDRVEDIIESYRGQLQLYEEALEASMGKPVKESYLYLFQYVKPVRVE